MIEAKMLEELLGRIAGSSRIGGMEKAIIQKWADENRLHLNTKTNRCAALRSCLKAHGATQCPSLLDKVGCGK